MPDRWNEAEAKRLRRIHSPEPRIIVPCPHCGREAYDRIYRDDKGISRHSDCGGDVRIMVGP